MTILSAIGLIGALASIAGLLYAIYYARKQRRVKQLLYDTSRAVPLATAQSPEDDYSLSVVFQRKEFEEEKISSVDVRFLRFANLGKEPIRREDIAPANPLKINVNGVRTLDISLSGSSRPVAKVDIQNITLGEESSSGEIEFDFLDFQDGGVIKILTEGGTGEVSLSGDIIGMPEGIRRNDEVRSLGFINKIGYALGGFIQSVALVLAVFAYRWISGTWDHIWLLTLPFIALFLPALIFGIIAATIWPNEDVPLPSSLALPKWFRQLPYYRMLRHSKTGNTMLFSGPEMLERDED